MRIFFSVKTTSIQFFFSTAKLSQVNMVHLLTPRTAKRRKLCDDEQLTINSYLLKPRRFYELVHGKKERHVAYELCLSLIDYATTWGFQRIPFHKWPRDLTAPFFGRKREYVKMLRIGVPFPCNKTAISRKAILCEEIRHFEECSQTMFIPQWTDAIRYIAFEASGPFG